MRWSQKTVSAKSTSFNVTFMKMKLTDQGGTFPSFSFGKSPARSSRNQGLEEALVSGKKNN